MTEKHTPDRAMRSYEQLSEASSHNPSQEPEKRPKRIISIGNPWGLTEKEARALQALIDHGQGRNCYQSLGYSQGTLRTHLFEARLKMREYEGRNVCGVQPAVLWDRWARGDWRRE